MIISDNFASSAKKAPLYILQQLLYKLLKFVKNNTIIRRNNIYLSSYKNDKEAYYEKKQND